MTDYKEDWDDHYDQDGADAYPVSEEFFEEEHPSEPPQEAIGTGETFQIDEAFFDPNADFFVPPPDGAADEFAYGDDGLPDEDADSEYDAFDEDGEAYEDEYEDERELRRRRRAEEDDRVFRPRRRRRTGLMGGVMYAAFILSISAIIAFVGWMVADEVLGLTAEEFVVEVTIPENFTLDEVTEELHTQGLISYPSVFRFLAGFFNYADRIQPGVYQVSPMDYRALIGSLNQRTGALIEVNVTIIEGLMNRQIFALLEANGVASAEALQYAADNIAFEEFEFLAGVPMGAMNRLEGYLFPDTYTFFRGQNPESAIRTMLRNFNVRMNQNDVYDLVEESPFTLHEILNIASMIERETASVAEMPRIASVIWNRINEGWHLNIDATIQFLLDEPMEFLTTAVIEAHRDSPYNTYFVIGLPYGPTANPGMAAILAALSPESTNFMFYALHIDGDRHHFTRTYAEHNAFLNTPDFAHFGWGS